MGRAGWVEIQNVDYSVRVGFWLKRKLILKSVTASISEGSVTGFLGPNGAGKTSLIQLLVGIRSLASGTIHIGGHPVGSIEARELIGFLPERPYFPGFLTARQVLRQFGKLSDMSSESLKTRIPATLERVGILRAIDQELRTYSKGMLQRLGIAQAILHDPSLLILDEPMSGLDPLGRMEIRNLIQQLAREGHTVFFSSHVVPDVEAISDHLILIQNGSIVQQGRAQDILEDGEGRFEVWLSSLTGKLDLDRIKNELQKLGLKIHFFEPKEDRLRLVLGEMDSPAWLASLPAMNANLISMNPVRTHIEDLFARPSASSPAKSEGR